jgi:hypothetical protein
VSAPSSERSHDAVGDATLHHHCPPGLVEVAPLLAALEGFAASVIDPRLLSDVRVLTRGVARVDKRVGI